MFNGNFFENEKKSCNFENKNPNNSVSCSIKNLKTINLSGNNIVIKREEILNYFHNSFSLYEELFSFLEEEAYYIKAEPLRHPLIFYLGHTAAFIINKLIISGENIQRINPKFESVFAVGVDEMSWDDLDIPICQWPSVEEVMDYRRKVREFFDKFVKNINLTFPITQESVAWKVFMIIEHEKIHLETSSVIIRRVPLNYFNFKKKSILEWPKCEEFSEKVPENEFISIPKQTVRLGKDDNYFGWDNEYGCLDINVSEFKVQKYLTTNKEYLEFIIDDGYRRPDLWSDEGKKWLKFQTLNRPLFWSEDFKTLRILKEDIEMPWDWPVEVNYLEANAYSNWKSVITGRKLRLLTEPEWYVLRGDNDLDGNIHLNHWASSCPVNKFKHNYGVYDVIGNVWQWTESKISPLPGFNVHPIYLDFSTPTFDNKHNLIKGGSWISTGNLSIKSSRYAFRRHFYQHAGFRLVDGEELHETDVLIQTDAEVSKWISAQYETEMYRKFNIIPYTKTVFDVIKFYADESTKTKKILVLGCKTGGLNFLLSSLYSDVVGMDQTAYYFSTPISLKEGMIVKYKIKEEGEIFGIKEIKLECGNYSNVEFYQTDFYNEIKCKKHQKYDSILISNVDDIDLINGNYLLKILNEGAYLFVMVPKGKSLSPNKFSSNNFKKLNLINNTLNPFNHKILYRETLRKHKLEIYELHTFVVEKRENSNNYYETDFMCEQYIRLHFANRSTFPSICGIKCLETLGKLDINDYENALDIGCAVGQTSIILSEKFKFVTGIDYSNRFIEIANERQKELKISNIRFVKGSALALEEIELLPKNNSLVFCGNLIDRLSNPKNFLINIASYIKPGGVLILTSPYTWLEEFTPKENWIGAFVSNGEMVHTIFELELILKDNFVKFSVEDVEFNIPDFPPFSSQMTLAEMSVWIRK